MDAPSLEVFKTRLDGGLGNLVHITRVGIRCSLRSFPAQPILWFYDLNNFKHVCLSSLCAHCSSAFLFMSVEWILVEEGGSEGKRMAEISCQKSFLKRVC